MGLGGPLVGGAPLTELAGAVRAWFPVTEQTQPSETQVPSPSSSTLSLCHFTSLHLSLLIGTRSVTAPPSRAGIVFSERLPQSTLHFITLSPHFIDEDTKAQP